MIVPMKKICIVVQDNSREEALGKLREVGVVHLEKRNIPLDNSSSAHIRKTKVEEAIGLISDFKVPKKKKKPLAAAADDGSSILEDDRPPIERRQKPAGLHRGRRATDVFGTEDEAPYSIDAVMAPVRPYLPDVMLNIEKERKALHERDIYLNLEISRIAPWGNFDPEAIKEMESFGLPVFLYEIASEVYNNLGDDVQCIKMKSDKAVARLVVFGKEIPGIAPFKLPEKSMNALMQEAEKIKVDLEDLTARLKNFADRRQALDKEMTIIEQDLEFETAVASLEKIDGMPPELNSSNCKLSWITGYIPKGELNHVKRAAIENGWGLSADDPSKTDEAVPTKLKNKKFVNLLNPVTGFLSILPGYHEVDISPWFFIFFCIFFGMIFGDAAYGLILILLAIGGIAKAALDKKRIPQGMLLLMLLGAFNTIWGVLTCSWFGVNVESVPQFLQKISLSYISTAKTAPDVVTQNMQIFCFSLGLIHLTIAHVNNIVRRIRTPRFLADIGSIAMLAGMYNVVLFLIVSNETRSIPLLPVSLYAIAGGFFLNFLFGAYEVSVKQSILSGLKNIIPVVSGVINIFSDIMSYIRLWAVGLAGASIAETINALAGPMLGNFLVFAGIILLIFGHSLNMVLNVLSMLVHGVRLNTLEFSSHVGLGWSGIPYRPFAEKVFNKK